MEITGPTDRKMVVNALNSGAKTFMADFEGECRTGIIVFFFLLYSNERLTDTRTGMFFDRLKLPHLEEHGQRSTQPLRCHPPSNRL